jgi:hypothetical protein
LQLVKPAKEIRVTHLSSIFLALALTSLTGITAVQASDFRSPRTSALGGAGHAGPILNDGIYLNPSYAAFLPTYGISINYLAYTSPTDPYGSQLYHGHILNASIQDGSNPLFQAGVGVSLRDSGKLINFGAAKAAIKQLGFGIGAKIYLPNAGPNISDTSFSTTWAITKWIQAAFIADNLIQSQNEVLDGFYREFTLGTKFNIQSIMLIYIDPHLTPWAPGLPSYGYEAGLELTPFTDLFFRLGVFHNANLPELNNTRGAGFGLGVGWIGPRLSLDYGLSHVTQPGTELAHVIGATIFF